MTAARVEGGRSPTLLGVGGQGNTGTSTQQLLTMTGSSLKGESEDAEKEEEEVALKKG